MIACAQPARRRVLRADVAGHRQHDGAVASFGRLHTTPMSRPSLKPPARPSGLPSASSIERPSVSSSGRRPVVGARPRRAAGRAACRGSTAPRRARAPRTGRGPGAPAAPRSGFGSSPPRGRRARATRARCTRSGASRTADRRRGGRASGGSLVAQRASSDGRWRLGEPPSGGADAEIWRPGGRKGSHVAVRWVGPTGSFPDHA